MKLLIPFFLASVLLLNVRAVYAQTCVPPFNVIVLVPIGGDFDDFATLQWEYNAACPLEYFEIEYAMGPFTPGMGEGTLVTPVYPNPPQPYIFNNLYVEDIYVWIRAVCDPTCSGNVGGDDIYGSNWVQADIMYTGPTSLPPGAMCGTASNEMVQSFQECDYQGTMDYPDYIFYDQFNETASLSPESVPCSEEGVFMVYQKFTATDAGIVEISVEENEESDFGLIVYDGPCNEGEVVDCAESFTNPYTLENLIPGEEYYVGFWQIGYNPYFFYDGDWVDFNYFFITTKICEPGCGNFTITAGPDSTIACGDSLPEPVYTVEGSWCTGYSVSIETSSASGCGETITRTYTATDSLGNTVSATQQFILTDEEPPMIVSVPEDLSLTCEEEWNSETPEFSDNCSAEIEITHVVDTILNDGCEILIEEIWQATDDCENTTTVVRSVSIQDEIPPTITCPDDIEVILSEVGQTYVLVDLTDGIEVADNCAESVSISQSIDPGTELIAGEHTVTLTASDGCHTASCDISVEVIVTTSVDDVENQHVILYPNPSDGMVIIQRNDASPLQVDVFDIRGKLILSESFNTQEFDLDLHHVAKGSYTIRLQSATYSFVEKIIIK